MDRLRAMETLVAIVDAGGFARAGARLGMSPPAVTRAVAALEDRIGARLMTRTTRRVHLTEAGMLFLESSRRLLAELDAAERAAAGSAAEPQGHLALTASVTLGRTILLPIVTGFLASHAQVTASMILVDRVVDLIEEGLDVGVRIGDLPESSLVASRVGMVRRILVASPTYLERHGVPRHSSDLKRHSIIAFTGLMSGPELRLARGGRVERVAVAPRLAVTDAGAALTAAEAGEGIMPVLSYMVAEQVRSGRLKVVLKHAQPPPTPVHLVYPQGRMLASKVRAFIDYARPKLMRALEDA